MARWTGTWLSGLGAAGYADAQQDRWRGERLGLPASGAGSIASTGARFVSFLLDIAAAALIGGVLRVIVEDPSAGQRNLAGNVAFALQVLLLTALTGQSIGMRVMRLQVVRLDQRDAAPGFLPAAIRTALLVLLVPAMVTDRDGRGLHDKAAGTMVLRTRGAPDLER
ncbi:MAG: hypothetical protein JWN88_664 [Frankiales bacterium]|jgi:uncharacterized RDD family membrane protein YckC|nr:hypothetical protein [Frankiales bacterium]